MSKVFSIFPNRKHDLHQAGEGLIHLFSEIAGHPGMNQAKLVEEFPQHDDDLLQDVSWLSSDGEWSRVARTRREVVFFVDTSIVGIIWLFHLRLGHGRHLAAIDAVSFLVCPVLVVVRLDEVVALLLVDLLPVLLLTLRAAVLNHLAVLAALQLARILQLLPPV